MKLGLVKFNYFSSPFFHKSKKQTFPSGSNFISKSLFLKRFNSTLIQENSTSNLWDQHERTKQLENQLINLSFYRFVNLQDAEFHLLRYQLLIDWGSLNISGRIYLGPEGINAQMTIPKCNLPGLYKTLNQIPQFQGLENQINFSVDLNNPGFSQLSIRVREQIVSMYKHENIKVNREPKKLSAIEWNKAMEEPNSVIVDVRNDFESEVGHFEHAICPEVKTFKESLAKILELLEDKKENKILMYCTGGIRCEKAALYLEENGFQNVFSLDGGIVKYSREIQANQIPSKFKGKNFSFDERLGERITNDVLSKCHQCGNPCDDVANCENDLCHRLFIQCSSCASSFERTCSKECQDELHYKIKNNQHSINKRITFEERRSRNHLPFSKISFKESIKH